MTVKKNPGSSTALICDSKYSSKGPVLFLMCDEKGQSGLIVADPFPSASSLWMTAIHSVAFTQYSQRLKVAPPNDKTYKPKKAGTELLFQDCTY